LGLIVFAALVRLATLVSESGAAQKNDPQKQLQQQAEQAMASQKFTPPTSAEQRKIDADQKKAAAELDKENEQSRVAYAKFIEESLLREDMNVDVTAYGPKHKYMTLKWVLVSKATAFNFGEQRQDMLTQMRKIGFTKFRLTDGYDESWTWDLTN
jgi:hypothetical protein